MSNDAILDNSSEEMFGDGQSYRDAIEFIYNSAIFTSDKYLWIRGLIEKVLNDTLSNDDVEGVLLGISDDFSGEVIKDSPSELQSNSQSIKRIQSIEEASNIGLLRIDKSIKFSPKLNIFYGKNSAGKSSMYQALCAVLGKDNNVKPDVNSENAESKCKIKCLNEESREKYIEWIAGSINPPQKVMIFDKNLSTYIIEKEQDNLFELAHLKVQYFSLILALYIKLDEKFAEYFRNTDEKIEQKKQLLLERARHIFDDGFELSREYFNDIQLNGREEDELNDLTIRLKNLISVDSKHLIRSLNSSQKAVGEMVNALGVVKNIDGTDKLVSKVSVFSIKGFNDLLTSYSESKRALDTAGDSNEALFNPSWADDEIWIDFISSSIKFIKSLSEIESKKYLGEECLYCHQKLETDQSRQLIKKYHELQLDIESKVNKLKNSINTFTEDVKSIKARVKSFQQELTTIDENIKLINSEWRNVQQDFTVLERVLDGIVEKSRKFEMIELEKHDVKVLDDFWTELSALFEVINDGISRAQEDDANKDLRIKEFTERIEKIRRRKSEVENKGDILELITLIDRKEIITEKIKQLVQFKRYLSSLRSKFYMAGVLVTFKKHLDAEYENFNIRNPNSWQLQISTNKDDTRRAYRLGDEETLLSEIFSEGEQKIHSLADFFAQAEMDKYKGIFIFDDPVNSLDEDNIECVANRIKALTRKDNQVFVFTHNKFFLNCLFDNECSRVTMIRRFGAKIFIEPDMQIGNAEMLSKYYLEIENDVANLRSKEERLINENEIRMVYDKISSYLEDYVELSYLKNVVIRFRPQVKMSNLHRLKDIDLSIIADLVNLWKDTHSKAIRHSKPESAAEITMDDLNKDFARLEGKFSSKK